MLPMHHSFDSMFCRAQATSIGNFVIGYIVELAWYFAV
jgi:hypothetical protein